MRGSFVAAGLIVLSGAVFGMVARAADFEEYRELVDRANRLIEAVREVSAEALPALRETAVEADLAVIEWLDGFIASPDFQGLADDQQAAVLTDRYRWEYNLSIQLIGLGRCEEALTRLQDLLLESPGADQELQDRLLQTLGEAAACATPDEPQMVMVRVESSTPGAQVAIDGVPRGAAPLDAQVETGSHVAEISAPGFITQSIPFATRGAQTLVGPVALVELTAIETDRGSRTPTWYEWTLWGVGAVGIGTGVVFLVSASGLQDDIDNPPDGFRVSDDAPDVDAIRTAGFVLGGVGIVSAAVGLVLFLTGDEEFLAPSDVSPRTAFLTPNGFGVRF